MFRFDIVVILYQSLFKLKKIIRIYLTRAIRLVIHFGTSILKEQGRGTGWQVQYFATGTSLQILLNSMETEFKL